MAIHNELGEKGEEIAKDFLIRKGYSIIKTNWTYGKLEIDIIAINNDFIVFIEVKTRSSAFIVEPEAAVTRKKQKQIIKAADKYMTFNSIDKEARFDIITVLVSGEKIKITHIEDAYYPTL